MRRMINGREFEIPTSRDGSINSDVLRRAASIPPDRPLVLQRDNGSNEIINPGEKIRPGSADHFSDMPAHRRGD